MGGSKCKALGKTLQAPKASPETVRLGRFVSAKTNQSRGKGIEANLGQRGRRRSDQPGCRWMKVKAVG